MTIINKEILICVTFRDFDNENNIKIQKTFLDSLEKQTYKNFTLIVTIFNEKKVEDYLNFYNFKKKFIYSTLENFHMSWSELIINSFKFIEKDKNIILWTNADNIFDANYLYEVNKNFEDKYSGTSWPMFHYRTKDDLEKNKLFLNDQLFKKNEKYINNNFFNLIIRPFLKKNYFKYDPNLWVPDNIFIDGNILLKEENQKLFSDYKMNGYWPGSSQVLMLGMLGQKKINLFFKTKVKAIRNIDFNWTYNKLFFNQNTYNKLIVNEYVNFKKINYKFHLNHRFCKINQNFQFKIISNINNILEFKLYKIIWVIYIYLQILSNLLKKFKFKKRNKNNYSYKIFNLDFFMIVSGDRDIFIADQTISNFNKIQNINFCLNIYNNYVNEDLTIKYFNKWKRYNFVKIIKTNPLIRKKIIKDSEFNHFQGNFDPVGNIFDEELVKLKSDYICIIHPDFEIIKPNFIYYMINELSKDTHLVGYSCKVYLRKRFLSQKLPSEIINKKNYINRQYQDFFLIYKKNIIKKFKNISFKFKYKIIDNNNAEVWDTNSLFQQNLYKFGYFINALGNNFSDNYIHYGSFAENTILGSKGVFFYRNLYKLSTFGLFKIKFTRFFFLFLLLIFFYKTRKDLSSYSKFDVKK